MAKVTSFQVQGNTYSVDADLTFDTTPTVGSTNPVTSNGIYNAVIGATVGTDISVGRTANTPIGYCSIAYGKNNAAAGDYSIVFGTNNNVYSDASIVSGYSNLVTGSANAAFATSSQVHGYYSTVNGTYNRLGMDISLTKTPATRQKPIAGYLNLTAKKVYYDAEMTNEITLPKSSSERVLIVDLRTNGMYEYYYVNARNFSFTYLATNHVFLVNQCASLLYRFVGFGYYDSANDKAYSDSGKTTEMTIGSTLNDKWNHFDLQVFFDLVSNQFVLSIPYSSISKLYYGSKPKFAKVNVYYTTAGYNFDPRLSTTQKIGRIAYVYTAWADRSKMYRVYSSDDYQSANEITDQLYDGEVIINADMPTGTHYNYIYVFNTDKIPVLVLQSDEYTKTSPNGSLCLGSGNVTPGGSGSIVAGYYNTILYGCNGSAVFGQLNQIKIYDKENAQMLLAGKSNIVTSYTNQINTGVLLGFENNYTVHNNGDRVSMIGTINNYDTYIGWESVILGTYNNVYNSDRVHILGLSNELHYSGSPFVWGYYNNIGSISGFDISKATIDKSGIITGSGISYDSSTKTYTYPTQRIFEIYGFPDDAYSEGSSSSPSRTNERLLMLGYSNDGHTLTNISYMYGGTPTTPTAGINSFFNSFYNNYVVGYGNRLYRSGADFMQRQYSGYNVIIGKENQMTTFGSVGDMLIGTGLKNTGFQTTSDDASGYGYHQVGVQIFGAYNDDSNTMSDYQKAKFIVGIGTSDSSRANGLIIYSNGKIRAPKAPSTFNSAVQDVSYNPMEQLVTLGLLMDYAPKTPGAIGTPAQTIVILDKDSWSDFTQEVTVSDITTSSVVIIQPSGNPHAFYTDEIYLDSQDTDKLTFKCSVGPTVDISVKVVYWV